MFHLQLGELVETQRQVQQVQPRSHRHQPQRNEVTQVDDALHHKKWKKWSVEMFFI